MIAQANFRFLGIEVMNTTSAWKKILAPASSRAAMRSLTTSCWAQIAINRPVTL